MMKVDQEQLADVLKYTIEEEADDVIRLLAHYVDREAVDITSKDGEPEELTPGDSARWVVSVRELLIDGEFVAEWSRCGRGQWGEAGVQCSEDTWCVQEDTEGGDVLPEMVAMLIEALGLEDEIPDVPSPVLATEEYTEDTDGGYAVYWETVGGGGPHRRYSTLVAAKAVCDQKNREFCASNPSGGCVTYQCGYSVRCWMDGEWQEVDECEDD